MLLVRILDKYSLNQVEIPTCRDLTKLLRISWIHSEYQTTTIGRRSRLADLSSLMLKLTTCFRIKPALQIGWWLRTQTSKRGITSCLRAILGYFRWRESLWPKSQEHRPRKGIYQEWGATALTIRSSHTTAWKGSESCSTKEILQIFVFLVSSLILTTRQGRVETTPKSQIFQGLYKLPSFLEIKKICQPIEQAEALTVQAEIIA